MTAPIVQECYARACAGLKNNATAYGLLAASPDSEEGKHKQYTSLFSRDIGVCALGMLATGDPELVKIVESSLDSLSTAQSDRGQLPFFFQPDNNKVEWWMPGSIDSTLWWSIALLKHKELTRDDAFFTKHEERLDKAFTWLLYQDTNNDCLLEQGEASDWADEMPRLGAVLYTNALWYWLVRLRVEVEGNTALAELQARIGEAVNTLLRVHKRYDDKVDYVPDNEYVRRNSFARSVIEWTNTQVVYLPYYLSYISHRNFGMRCDVYGNILAMISGLASKERCAEITDHIFRSGIDLPYPVKVMYPPIYPGESDWRLYMQKGRQNYPWQYHNGGIWPYVGGFWVMWLGMSGDARAAGELDRLAAANEINDWEFNEYLHGQHGTPMGIPLQSWNMGMYLAAYHEVEKSGPSPID